MNETEDAVEVFVLIKLALQDAGQKSLEGLTQDIAQGVAVRFHQEIGAVLPVQYKAKHLWDGQYEARSRQDGSLIIEEKEQ